MRSKSGLLLCYSVKSGCSFKDANITKCKRVLNCFNKKYKKNQFLNYLSGLQ